MIYTVTLNPAIDKEYKVPRLLYDEVLRMESMQIDYGGKGFNVSRMLKSLGTESIALGFVGGHTGEVIAEGLNGLGIQTDLTPILGETRTNTSIVEQASIHHIKINESGPVVSDSEVEAFIDKVGSLSKPGDYWVMAGSLPNNVPDDIYAKIIQRVKAAGSYTILDTSGVPLRFGLDAKPFLIKPNLQELGQIFDQNIDNTTGLAAVVSKLHAMGVKNVLVSLGKDGAYLSDSHCHWKGHAPAITVQNPIGAGDAMVAGMVWRLNEGDSLAEAFPWSIACGTAAANQSGTGMPSLAQVRKFKTQVEIEEL